MFKRDDPVMRNFNTVPVDEGYIEAGIHKLVQDDKKRQRLLDDIEASSMPLVSVGPYPIGHPMQKEIHAK